MILKYAKSSHPKHSIQPAAMCASVSKTHAYMHSTPSPQMLPRIFRSQLKSYFPHTKGKVWIPYYAVCSLHIAFFLVILVTTLRISLSFNIYTHRKTISSMKEAGPSLVSSVLVFPTCQTVPNWSFTSFRNMNKSKNYTIRNSQVDSKTKYF